jgi:carbamoyltransferase
MNKILGVSAGFHDAAIAVLNQQGEIEFAGHSERYSKRKNDSDIALELLNEIDTSTVGTIAYYERPWLRQTRQLYAGQGVDWNQLTTHQVLEEQLGYARIRGRKIKSYGHHLSHAAAGFQTSEFDLATVVVIDAIGEWDTVSIWGAKYDRKGEAVYTRLWSQRYPHSIGLFYSAATGRVGLQPLDEEYILMGMAAYGERGFGSLMRQDLVEDAWEIKFKHNLHVGLEQKYLSYIGDMDIAAGAQDLVEDLIVNVMRRARGFGWSRNLVYMGGVALNCSANRLLGEHFDNLWIMPCPGDAGSSLGAAALAFKRKIHWHNAYLGHNIDGDYPVNSVLDHLLSSGIVGVASGRAEFGPRALGNRSLLADPRGTDIKDRVNEIKRRQKFRPFAPVILEELASDFFNMPCGWHHSRYMQSVAVCRNPDIYPAISHVDGTSRVQTVPKDGSGIRELLEKWYVMTGCPMLLNTSLNIRGEPMVNDRRDADRFEKMYSVTVCS